LRRHVIYNPSSPSGLRPTLAHDALILIEDDLLWFPSTPSSGAGTTRTGEMGTSSEGNMLRPHPRTYENNFGAINPAHLPAAALQHRVEA
jgi:hypothetical protein